ncbi:lysine--tRNA ligase [bacterium]|nr:lysine--tRNA ligase [bacterium]
MSERDSNTMEAFEETEVTQQRIDDIQSLREKGIDPYGGRYERSHTTARAIQLFLDSEDPSAEKFESPPVRLAGRLMGKREMGKAIFGDLHDLDGHVQLYFKKNDFTPEVFEEIVKALNLGDIIGVEGPLFRTRTGEITLHVREVTVLSKVINNLPPLKETTDEAGHIHRFFQFADVEMRYRQRYLDLILNRDVRDHFRKRSRMVSIFRRELDQMGYMEVETPMMHHIAGGAAARPFITHHNALDIDLYLRIAPELHLKRLIVGGMEAVYEINRNFRNEGISIKHNPEFTMLEAYKAYGDRDTVMELCEHLVSTAVEDMFGGHQVAYQGITLDFKRPWKRISMIDAIHEVVGIELDLHAPLADLLEKTRGLGIDTTDLTTHGKIINAVFEEKVEESLIQPTFIIDYPTEISPLARQKKDDPDLVERFELFIYGRETANGFSELNDPAEQYRRFEEQLAQRQGGDQEAHPMDLDYVNALRCGMPPAGGIGIGIDRLAMILTDSASIRDVILFPLLRPKE